ncbi:GNAT family N-acetyltransferase [Thalassotalea profundi]|uniref:N-acetyltransferase domain-containing protein n=1 Tax=Thalassotalea profundi TaxID=2036687 RepID=A0ABQ3IYG0_9GAMM|nr:GNAT family N-acetyltransferase [Thalassotalea profundi]GHE94660.1 hypothetical protein GCM10011501_25120 [Thalassotalea profundi]
MLKTERNAQANMLYREMSPEDFHGIIKLATKVHGEGYMDEVVLRQWYKKGVYHNINASFVAYCDNLLVGFRITYAQQQWMIDQWCTPESWSVSPEHVCYFKCNTVDENYRGFGVGSQLLSLAIEAAKKQGSLAGVSHLWRQSPGNSAVKYFSKCGGQLIKNHPERWNELSQEGYVCPVCDNDCHCVAAEMIINF